MRGNKPKQLAQEERKVLEEKRSAESKVRKEKRKAKSKAEETAKGIQRSPAGKKAAETLQKKRTIGRKTEQSHYQKVRTRASARIGGRRKQIAEQLHGKLEE